MTQRLPDDTKHARIVLQIAGPIESLQLCHVPSDWVRYRTGCGPDPSASVERLHRAAERRGYLVEAGYAIEDWNPRIGGAMRS